MVMFECMGGGDVKPLFLARKRTAEGEGGGGGGRRVEGGHPVKAKKQRKKKIGFHF